jgi:hypothetical protein
MSELKKVKRRRKTSTMQGWLLWFALTAAFSLMGVGMAMWQGEMTVGGAVNTGYVEVGFTDYYGGDITTTEPEGWVDPLASISINRINNEELMITINGAYPGLEAQFWYEIKNTGSLPVRRYSYKVTFFEGVAVTGTPPDRIEVGDQEVGTINVTVDAEAPSSVYEFTMEIGFELGL